MPSGSRSDLRIGASEVIRVPFGMAWRAMMPRPLFGIGATLYNGALFVDSLMVGSNLDVGGLPVAVRGEFWIEWYDWKKYFEVFGGSF